MDGLDRLFRREVSWVRIVVTGSAEHEKSAKCRFCKAPDHRLFDFYRGRRTKIYFCSRLYPACINGYGQTLWSSAGLQREVGPWLATAAMGRGGGSSCRDFPNRAWPRLGSPPWLRFKRFCSGGRWSRRKANETTKCCFCSRSTLLWHLVRVAPVHVHLLLVLRGRVSLPTA
jgi:hypothetical protein